MLRLFLYGFSFLIFSAVVCFAQKSETVTTRISEPASVSLETLFAQADLVAFVKIRSGDAENYNHAIYKAEVLESYKGAKLNDVIYFTPFIGYGIGSEYLVFLKKADKRIGDIIGEDAKNKTLPYDAMQSFYRIMYEGYSIMPVSYECVFKETPDDSCHYAVKFNTYQVKLPKNLKTFPKEDEKSESSDSKYVKRETIEPVLKALKRNRK